MSARGGHHNVSSSSGAISNSNGSQDGDEEEGSNKTKKRLARKAELARESRRRRKQWVQALEDKVARLTAKLAEVTRANTAAGLTPSGVGGAASSGATSGSSTSGATNLTTTANSTSISAGASAGSGSAAPPALTALTGGSSSSTSSSLIAAYHKNLATSAYLLGDPPPPPLIALPSSGPSSSNVSAASGAGDDTAESMLMRLGTAAALMADPTLTPERLHQIIANGGAVPSGSSSSSSAFLSSSAAISSSLDSSASVGPMVASTTNIYPIKAEHNSDRRRFNLPNNRCCFADLVAVLRDVYRFPARSQLTIHYRDDEGDLISIASDTELLEAFRIGDVALAVNGAHPSLVMVRPTHTGSAAVPVSSSVSASPSSLSGSAPACSPNSTNTPLSPHMLSNNINSTNGNGSRKRTHFTLSQSASTSSALATSHSNSVSSDSSATTTDSTAPIDIASCSKDEIASTSNGKGGAGATSSSVSESKSIVTHHAVLKIFVFVNADDPPAPAASLSPSLLEESAVAASLVLSALGESSSPRRHSLLRDASVTTGAPFHASAVSSPTTNMSPVSAIPLAVRAVPARPAPPIVTVRTSPVSLLTSPPAPKPTWNSIPEPAGMNRVAKMAYQQQQAQQQQHQQVMNDSLVEDSLLQVQASLQYQPQVTQHQILQQQQQQQQQQQTQPMMQLNRSPSPLLAAAMLNRTASPHHGGRTINFTTASPVGVAPLQRPQAQLPAASLPPPPQQFHRNHSPELHQQQLLALPIPLPPVLSSCVSFTQAAAPSPSQLATTPIARQVDGQSPLFSFPLLSPAPPPSPLPPHSGMLSIGPAVHTRLDGSDDSSSADDDIE